MDKANIDATNRSAYLRDFVPGIVGYAIVLAVVLPLVGDRVEGPGEWALLMLPIVPALWVLRAVLLHLRRIDEYQRLLQLEALAAGFGVAMIASLTLGFVGVGGVATRAAGWIVYGAGMAAWGLVAAVQGRRQ